MEYHLLDLFVAIARRQENAKETLSGMLALAVAAGETWRTFWGPRTAETKEILQESQQKSEINRKRIKEKLFFFIWAGKLAGSDRKSTRFFCSPVLVAENFTISNFFLEILRFSLGFFGV